MLTLPSTESEVMDAILFLCVMCICLSACLIKSDRPTSKNRKDHRNVRLLQAGMLLTGVADFCFLILRQPEAGVAVFCFVQTIYGVRYDISKWKKTMSWIFLIASFCFAIIYIVKFLIQPDAFTGFGFLHGTAVIYGVCLGMAVYRSVCLYMKKEQATVEYREMILSGMILFLLCDINVALYNLIPDYVTFELMGKSISWSAFCGGLIWLFYLPSLFFLYMSGREYMAFHR